MNKMMIITYLDCVGNVSRHYIKLETLKDIHKKFSTFRKWLDFLEIHYIKNSIKINGVYHE